MGRMPMRPLRVWVLTSGVDVVVDVVCVQACRAVSQQTQARCFHQSPLSYAANKAAMSRLDDVPLPYDKLQKNYEVVKQR